MHPLLEQDDLVAQLVEQYTFNVWALGSSPSGITRKKPLRNERFLFLLKLLLASNQLGAHSLLIFYGYIGFFIQVYCKWASVRKLLITKKQAISSSKNTPTNRLTMFEWKKILNIVQQNQKKTSTFNLFTIRLFAL